MAERFTRNEILAKIKAGQSVMINHRVIHSEAQVPSVADLAAGDDAAEEQAASYYDEEIARLRAERAKVLKTVKKSNLQPRAAVDDSAVVVDPGAPPDEGQIINLGPVDANKDGSEKS